jgi:hypothetical protein
MNVQVVNANPWAPVSVGDLLTLNEAAQLCEVNAKDLAITGMLCTHYLSPDGMVEFEMIREPGDPFWVGFLPGQGEE